MTEKQKKFVEEYLIDLNATRAAIRAGYSPKTANEQGCQNLAKLSIKNAIAEAMAERSRRTGINQERVLTELAKMAFVNIDDVVDFDNGTIKENASKEDLACIQSIKIKPGEYGTEREVKLYDKRANLELIGKHLGMFKDKVEIETVMPVFGGEDNLED